jgi:thiamine-monophosphate kinase
MRVRDLGEFGLIARIERAASRVSTGSGVVLGIGDDGALVRARAGEDVVVTTDAFVEGVHFRWRNESPRTVGRRALVANLSDLAAMAARPLGFTLSLVAPPALEVKRVDGLVAGLVHEAERHGCPLVGGNVAAGGETSLSITALGAVARGKALTRRGARAGDRLCVTGVLGVAALDRARAERAGGRVRYVAEPRLATARALARVPGLGGCIDLSDGLEADAAHLLAPAGLALDLDDTAVPLAPRFAAACSRLGLDPLALACGGGEDYELLFTLRPSAPAAGTLSRRLGIRVTEVGRAVRAPRGGSPAPRGTSGSSPAPRGWRHF